MIEAIEQGMQVAAKKKYGAEYDIQVQADRKTGEFKIFKRLEVVEELTMFIPSFFATSKNSTGNANQNVSVGDHVTQLACYWYKKISSPNS